MLKAKKNGNGYGVKKNSNPDYLIEGKAFDCYAPDGRKASTVMEKVKNKTENQAQRIILNLEDYQGSMRELYSLFQERRITTLQELFVIINDQVIRWVP